MSAKELTRRSIVVGAHGETQLREGWHERAYDEFAHLPYRPATGRATLELLRDPTATHLCLLVSAPMELATAPIDGRITINSRRFQLPLDVKLWVLRRYPIESSRSVLQVRLELEPPLVPNNILNNGDTRQLGWYVSAVWQEAFGG